MYDQEIAECYRRIALGNSLVSLTEFNPDFKAVVLDGFLRDEVLAQSLNININKSSTIAFLRGAATFSKYLEKVKSDAAQAQVDLTNYQQLLQDARPNAYPNGRSVSG